MAGGVFSKRGRCAREGGWDPRTLPVFDYVLLFFSRSLTMTFVFSLVLIGALQLEFFLQRPPGQLFRKNWFYLDSIINANCAIKAHNQP